MRKDTIYRQDAIDAIEGITSNMSVCVNSDECHGMKRMQKQAVLEIANMSPAQPEPLSDAYMKAVWTWLLDYQIKAAELKGRYTPYEVLSWVVNDWRKEHDGSD